MIRLCISLTAILAALPARAVAQTAGAATLDAQASDAGVPPPAPARPPLPVPKAVVPPPAPAPPPVLETVVRARKPISAASSFSVQDRDFQLRPIGSVQDILRVTPGLVHRAALRRRQGEPVLPARLRRRPRHRPGADRSTACRSTWCRTRTARASPTPTSSSRRSSSAWRSPRARTSRTRATSRPRARSTWSRATTSSTARSAPGSSARPGTAAPGYRALVIASPKLGGRCDQGDVRRRDRPRERPVREPRALGPLQAVQQGDVRADAVVDADRSPR